MTTSMKTWACLAVWAGMAARGWALIEGGEGNTPLNDPGWPKGGAALVNHSGRVAYWVGPPFGGGQWHAECRGDAAALAGVVEAFAKLDAKHKRIVLHDGVGKSHWLGSNSDAKKDKDARIDWSVMVWESKSWERLRKLPPDFNPTNPNDDGPPAQLDVYAGRTGWTNPKLPAGIEVEDRRLSAHGFAAADGVVFQGQATDLSGGKPLAAKVRIERVVPMKKGGYEHPLVDEIATNAEGKWFLKNLPAGWLRVVVAADGYAPRVAGYATIDEQPRWQPMDCQLARAGEVAGRVVDADGQPVADAAVRLDEVAPKGSRYEAPDGYKATTDAQGKFRIAGAPCGKAGAVVHKKGYFAPQHRTPTTVPNDEVVLKLAKSAAIKVTVDFGGKPRPPGYMVTLTPEGGDRVGSYGGSANLGDDNQYTFKDVPPGRYTVGGHPNPHGANEKAAGVDVDARGGATVEAVVKAP